MNTGLGFTVDRFDVLAGVFALLIVIAIGVVAREIKRLIEFDLLSVDLDDTEQECVCSNSGQLAPEDMCGRCGHYCETGIGE